LIKDSLNLWKMNKVFEIEHGLYSTAANSSCRR
jgi:hypothetical protein